MTCSVLLLLRCLRFLARSRSATQWPFKIVQASEYAAKVGDPTVSRVAMKSSTFSSSPNGNWDTKASHGSSHAENCFSNTDQLKDSAPDPHAYRHWWYVMAVVFSLKGTEWPWLSVPLGPMISSPSHIPSWIFARQSAKFVAAAVGKGASAIEARITALTVCFSVTKIWIVEGGRE